MQITEVFMILIFTLGAGICIPIGGMIARFERIQPLWLEEELRHFVIALGGGILLGAVALVLVPEGIDEMDNSIFAVPVLLTGGIAFFFIERFLGLRRRETPQIMGMLLDFIPESIALGGLLVTNPSIAPLLALLIGLQNLPEGFNGYREIVALNKHHPKKALQSMWLMVAFGPVAGLTGYFFLSEHEAILGAIMLFASGGILYLIFQDIAPQSHLKKHWAPPLGAVIGFSITVFSQMLL
jgi:ZIP family zinc transporter